MQTEKFYEQLKKKISSSRCQGKKKLDTNLISVFAFDIPELFRAGVGVGMLMIYSVYLLVQN